METRNMKLTEQEIEFILKYRKLTTEYERGRVEGTLDFLLSESPRWRLVKGGAKK